MKQSICAPNTVPTANLAINKSRIKIYNKDTRIPTYYLEKGQEFQIELFNPTHDTVLAKVILNGTAIAQGGLVLRPGERVFLERYIDVASKFKFDTYEVSNTAEVKKAIEENGDLRVEFYRETKPLPNYGYNQTWINGNGLFNNDNNYYGSGTPRDFLRGSSGTGRASGASTLTTNGMNMTTTGAAGIGSISTYTSGINYSSNAGAGEVTLDSLSFTEPNLERKRMKKSLSKQSIETGRVEMGSQSNQKFEYVQKTFDSYAFCTVEYKLLPVSQKVNTTDDLHVKRYCTNCGAKHKEGNKFCPTCGNKA